MDEMERKLRFLEDCLSKERRIILTEPSRDELGRSLVQVDETSSTYVFHEEDSPKLKINDLERHLDQLEKEMSQMNTNQETLNKNCNELKELRFVLTKDSRFDFCGWFLVLLILYSFSFH
jgi:hypothetical protein